jgi:hypothetical protein
VFFRLSESERYALSLTLRDFFLILAFRVVRHQESTFGDRRNRPMIP